MAATDRRSFLRLLGLAALAACTRSPDAVDGSSSPSVSTTPPGTPRPTPTKKRSLGWRVIEGPGPSARRDHSLTALGNRLYLFGGRDAAGDRLDDLWELTPTNGTWRQIKTDDGPSKRLGHNAGAVGERLLIFGGQDGSTFFNDLWSFDPSTQRWRRLSRGAGPEVRYGGGGAVKGETFTVTHGFSFSTRYDDTWTWNGGWRDRSPSSGRRPIKRCLITTPYLASEDAIVLFGGQTDGTAFLGDTWLYDVGERSWRELAGDAPSPRNVYAAAATDDRLYLFGGETADGPTDELWRFDGARWQQLDPGGTVPRARSGVAGTILGNEMFVFGGRDGDRFFDNTWRLTLPA